MFKFKTLVKDALIVAAMGSVSLMVACGGDDDDSGTTPDAGMTDVDAMVDPPVVPYAATYGLTNTTISNNPMVSGAFVTIGIVDTEDKTGAQPDPVYNNSQDSCSITIHTPEQPPKPSLDGGEITITGTNAGEFKCNFVTDLGKYLCSSTDAAASGALPAGDTPATLTRPAPDTPAGDIVLLTVPGADFTNVSYVGAQITLAGFDDPKANQTLPVVNDPGLPGDLPADSLYLYYPQALTFEGPATIAGDTPGTYATFIGEGPVPLTHNFLSAGTAITVKKAELGKSRAIDATSLTRGEGFALLPGDSDDYIDESDVPQSIPLTTPHTMPFELPTEPVRFSCRSRGAAEEDADTCGVKPEGTVVSAMIVSGKTTSEPVSPADPYYMPERKDITKPWASFTCSKLFFGPQNSSSVEIPVNAMKLLLDTNPTRIQTTVTQGQVLQVGAGAIKDNFVLSTGLTGFTDKPVQAVR